MQMKNFWKWLGRLGIAAAVIVSGIQIWDWVNRPSETLEAQIGSGPFVLPQQITAVFATDGELVGAKWIGPLLDKSLKELRAARVPDDLAASLTSRTKLYLLEVLSVHLGKSVESIRGLWRVTIRNGGAQPLKEVRLVLPWTKSVLIEKEGSKPEQREVDSVIEIDRIHPGEAIHVIAWAASEPDYWSKKNVRLTHSFGTGTVSFLEPVGAVGQFFDRYWTLALSALVLSVLTFSPALIEYARRHRSSKHDEPSTPKISRASDENPSQ